MADLAPLTWSKGKRISRNTSGNVPGIGHLFINCCAITRSTCVVTQTPAVNDLLRLLLLLGSDEIRVVRLVVLRVVCLSLRGQITRHELGEAVGLLAIMLWRQSVDAR